MHGRVLDWIRDMRAIWGEFDRLQAEVETEAPSYYGWLGEMGHPDDRADDWPGADTGT